LHADIEDREGRVAIAFERIDHISMAVAELAPQVELLERLFGFRATGGWTEDDQGYRGMNLDVPGTSNVGFEVLAPLGENSFVQRFLESPNGPGLHHVTLEVDSVDETVEELRRLGIEPWGTPPNEGEPWREVFIHPKFGSGYLFQFAGHEHSELWNEGEEPIAEDRGEYTLGIVAVNHLSHAHPSRDELAGWYERVLGFETIYRSIGADGDPDGPFATQVLETPTRQMRWEILQPNGNDSFVRRFLDERGPAMHHLTFEVGDWQRALDACSYHGVPVFGQRDGETDGLRWSEAFIHPRYTGGVLVQIFWEERPGIWI
jgi:methylmalonyl-CoA/ethylmalonyl-CoA epimerase